MALRNDYHDSSFSHIILLCGLWQCSILQVSVSSKRQIPFCWTCCCKSSGCAWPGGSWQCHGKDASAYQLLPDPLALPWHLKLGIPNRTEHTQPLKSSSLLLFDFTRKATNSSEVFLNFSCSQFIVITPFCLFFCEFVESGEGGCNYGEFVFMVVSQHSRDVCYVHKISIIIMINTKKKNSKSGNNNTAMCFLLSMVSFMGKGPFPEEDHEPRWQDPSPGAKTPLIPALCLKVSRVMVL